MGKNVRAKKSLGQHFLNNDGIAERIAQSVNNNICLNVLEIGPGMGVLSKHLWQIDSLITKLIELDKESVRYLNKKHPQHTDNNKLIEGDFLKLDLNEVFDGEKFSIIGNFPYNISSQILFKALDYRDLVPVIVGMFQKEVGERVCAKPGKKSYGIISVLLQAFYDTEYLFTVEPFEFSPPPKVRSGVIRLIRNNREQLPCDEKTFFIIVKCAFNQRRKTLRNALAAMGVPFIVPEQFAPKRAEQLSVDEFIELTHSFISQQGAH